MAKTVAEGFEKLLGDLTPLASQRAAAAKHRESVKTSLEKAMTIKLMRETGSFTHGTGVRSFSDVDVLASISGKRPDSSDTALRWVKEALTSSFGSTLVRISRPAVVVEFNAGAETWEVIPGFLTDRGGSNVYVYDIPGPTSGWIDSAPLEHLDYVNECNTLAGVQGGAKKLARLVKAWKYYRSVPISSFYLEMRCAKYLSTEKHFVPIFDLHGILAELFDHSLASMNDPKGASGRIHPCSSVANRSDALSKLGTAVGRARKALDAFSADETDDAFYYLNLLFDGHFPAR